MSKNQSKNNSLKARNKLGSHSDARSFSDAIGFTRGIPKYKSFTEKDLGNGFTELISKKKQ
jgi:hypothetical protein